MCLYLAGAWLGASTGSQMVQCFWEERGRSSQLPLRPGGWPSTGANPWGGGELLGREDPAQNRTGPVLPWVEGWASIFPAPLPHGSCFQGLFLPPGHIHGPLASPFSLSPSSTLRHLLDHPVSLRGHLLQEACLDALDQVWGSLCLAWPLQPGIPC